MFSYGVPETRLVTHDGEISNCILEIPQNINVTLENNVITHKSGSILTLGGSTYTTLKLDQDRSTTISASLADGIYFVNGTANGTPVLTAQTSFGSGDTLPELPSIYSRFFLTTNKQFYHSDGTQWNESGVSYPTCLIKMSGGVASFVVDNNGNYIIFNGWCYIGGSNNDTCSFIFYHNIKGLLSNRIDNNGNLNNISISRSALTIISRTSYITNGCINLTTSNSIHIQVYNDIEYNNLSDITNPIEYNIYYIKSENTYYRYLSGNFTIISELPFIIFDKSSTGVIIKQVRQPVRLATTEMTADLQSQVTANNKAAYHQPSDPVTLFDGDLGSGDIQLSDSFNNYEYLLIIYGNDSGNIMYSRMITSYELETVLSISSGGPYALCMQSNGDGYWFIKKLADGSTTTLLKYSSDDDIKVYKVIGINRKAS